MSLTVGARLGVYEVVAPLGAGGPPVVEICHLPPSTGNDVTYTSDRPDSFDAYVTRRPSGEITATGRAGGVMAKKSFAWRPTIG
jgi:hypothetical protein